MIGTAPMPRLRVLTMESILEGVPHYALSYGGSYDKNYKRKGSNELHTREESFDGSRIPTWMMERWRSGQWQNMSEMTEAKIRSAYRRWATAELRSAGVPTRELGRYIGKPPNEVLAKADLNRLVAAEIAKNKGVPYAAVLWGISVSETDAEDMDLYGDT